MASTQPQHPRLPLDVIHHVLDILLSRRDIQTLKAVACTCKQYSQPARRLLFRKVALRIDTQPVKTSISDISRRIVGLRDMLVSRPVARSYIQYFELLDSYPVYKSDWITRQPGLAHLIDMLSNVKEFVFGCSVGYLDTLRLPPELLQPLEKLIRHTYLKVLTLHNLRTFPEDFLRTRAAAVFLTNSHTNLISGASTAPTSSSRLKILSVRSECPADTECIAHLTKLHRRNLKVLKWRCWEDPRSTKSASFPPRTAIVDLAVLRALRKLVLRVSFGSLATDLTAFLALMSSIKRSSPLNVLEFTVICPEQRTDVDIRKLIHHGPWDKLANICRQGVYRALRRVDLTVTVHQFSMVLPNGQSSTSVVEVRNGLGETLIPLSNIPTLHFTLTVNRFFPDAKMGGN